MLRSCAQTNEIKLDFKAKSKTRAELKDKMTRNLKELVIIKLNMVINLKILNGVLLLKTILKRIELSRDLFIQVVEGGQEVFIP